MQFVNRMLTLVCLSKKAIIELNKSGDSFGPDIIPGFRRQLAAGFFIQPRTAMKLSM